MCNITAKHFDELSTRELYEIFKARFAVFYLEQRIVYPDLDDIDYNSIHVVAADAEGHVMGYARMFTEDSTSSVMHVGRMLTVEHGKGLGRKVMQHVIATAQGLGATILRLGAQEHAIGFYEKLGFKVTSAPFVEADIVHVMMELPL